MVFGSITFLYVLLPMVLTAYYVIPSVSQNKSRGIRSNPMKKTVALALTTLAMSRAFPNFRALPDKNEIPLQWAQFSFARSLDSGFEASRSFFSMEYDIAIAPFYAFAGAQLTDDTEDLTFSTGWFPLEFQNKQGLLKFGLDFDYHVEWYDGISCEHDFIISPELHWQTNHNFLISFRLGAVRKITDIYIISEKPVGSWGAEVIMTVGKSWKNGLEIRLEAGTHSMYRFPIYGTVILTPSVAYTLKSRFRAALEAEITMRDYFAASYYMDSVLIRATGRLLF